MVVLLELWPKVSRSMAKLSPFRRSMLGRGSYLVNYLEGISRRTEEVQSNPGRWVPHPCVLCKGGIPQACGAWNFCSPRGPFLVDAENPHPFRKKRERMGHPRVLRSYLRSCRLNNAIILATYG